MYKVLLATVLFGLLSAVYGQGDPPDTVDEINVELYLGRWYQVNFLCLNYYESEYI